MIGLILGTSEGKEILSKLNNFTSDIFVTTATAYGGELLKDYKYKFINSSPLSKEELKQHLIKYEVTLLVDATHPYAVEITKNTKEICKDLNIEYLRYERPSIVEAYLSYENIKLVDSLEHLKKEIIDNKIEGTILNTTGSRNIDKFMAMDLPNRIVHRILPTVDSVEKALNSGVKVDDIIAIKGPVGLLLNTAFIKEYEAKALVLKDSGSVGGTEEKLMAALDQGITAFVLERNKVENDKNYFDNIDRLIEYINKVYNGKE